MNFKAVFFALITMAISFLFCLVVLEVALRFLPVSEVVKTEDVTFEQPVHKFIPDENVTWSRDWNFSIVNRVRVNAQGFVNDRDYADASIPVVAVVGDSYVESLMVPFAQTLHGRMAADAGDQYRVYSFGAGGAPLSQYLVFARHAQDEYNVQGMVIPIIGNDFDESLPKYRFQDTFHQFFKNENDVYELRLARESRRSWVREMLRSSALIRYLYFNAELSQLWWRMKSALLSDGAGDNQYVGNTVAVADPERLADSRAVVDAFFRLLPDYSDLPPAQIIFVIDSARHKIYEADALPLDGQSYFEQMRAYFIGEARKRGYGVVDMDEAFFAYYRNTGEKFEFPTDGHWSGIGHGVVYETLRTDPAFLRMIEQVQQ